MYDKNDMSKYLKNRNVGEIYDTFIDTYKHKNLYSSSNSVFNSTAYSECKNSIGLFKDDSGSRISLRAEKDTITEKTNNFKAQLTRGIDRRMDEREYRLNNNINLLNIKFRDIKTTTPVMTTRSRFLGVSGFNKHAQKVLYYSDKTVERGNPLEVFLKSKSYKRTLPVFDK
jgi:hypothetical protein